MTGLTSAGSVRPRPVASGHLTLGGLFAALGDSVVTGSAAPPNTYGMAWPLWFQALSGGRASIVSFDGRPGKTSEDLQTGVQQVIASGAAFCFYGAGTNDVIQGFPLPRSVARITADVAALQNAGVVPVLVTLPPNSTSSYRNAILQFNAWLRRYAAHSRLPLLDFYNLLVDPASSGNYLAAYQNDGTHPNTAGYYAMGQLAWNTLSSLIPPGSPNLARLNTDPTTNLIAANAVFLTDANADGVPDSWTAFGGTTGFTHSIVTGDTSIVGNWAQIACSATAADRDLQFTTGAVIPGHRIAICGLMAVTAYSSGNGATVQTSFTGTSGTTVFSAYRWRTVTSGYFYQEAVIPAGASSINFTFVVGAGTCTAKLAQPTILDLTALGLA